MGEVVRRVMAQYRSVLGRRTEVVIPARPKRSDFEAVLSDWSTTVSDLGVGCERAIAKQAESTAAER